MRLFRFDFLVFYVVICLFAAEWHVVKRWISGASCCFEQRGSSDTHLSVHTCLLAHTHTHHFSFVTMPSGGCVVLWLSFLFVCLSVRVTWKLHGWSSPEFLCMLPAAMALLRTALRYVKYFRFCGRPHVFLACCQWSRIKHDLIKFTRWRQQLDIRWLVFGWVSQNVALGLILSVCLSVCLSVH